MDQKCKEFIDKLSDIEQSYNEDTLIESLYELTDSLEGVEGAEIVIPSILKFMEALSDVDLGTPGPLVHFIENYYPNYDNVLIESVKRKPVFLSVWMCNRILNADIENQRRENFISALRSVANNSDADETIKREAENYLEFQKNN